MTLRHALKLLNAASDREGRSTVHPAYNRPAVAFMLEQAILLLARTTDPATGASKPCSPDDHIPQEWEQKVREVVNDGKETT